jgi:hypothetical protein
MFVRCSNSSGGTPEHTPTVIDATQKQTLVDQQQHNCETPICQRHQTILRLLSSAAMASRRWRVRELYCQSTYSRRINSSFTVVLKVTCTFLTLVTQGTVKSNLYIPHTPLHAFLRKGSKAVCPMPQIWGILNNPRIYRGSRNIIG